MLNIIAPYRVPILRALAREFDLLVLHGGREPNRSWNASDALHEEADVRELRGWMLRVPRRRYGNVIGEQYVHIQPSIFANLAHFRPDVVISNEMGLRTWFAAVYSRLARIPHFVWWGGTRHTEAEIDQWRAMARRVIAASPAYFISYGRTSTAYLRTLGIPRERIVQIQNSVDETQFSPEGPGETFGLRGTRLLYVGQLIKRKGVDLLLDAVARQQARGADVSLAIIGDGPERANLEARARSLQLRGIHFQGEADYELLAQAYRGAHAVILPTLEDVWGLVVNEALLCGTPVACSIFAGCADELVPPPARFDPRDPAQFDRVLDMARAGGLPVERHRVWRTEHVVDVLLAAIHEALV